MDVVEHQHQSAFGRNASEQARNRIEDAKARLRDILGGGNGRQARKACGDFGHDLDQRAGLRAEHGSKVLVVVQRREPAAQDLQPGPVGRGADVVGAATPQHSYASRLRALREHLRSARLADAGFACEHEHAALHVERGGQRALHAGDFACASDEGLGESGKLSRRHGDSCLRAPIRSSVLRPRRRLDATCRSG